MERATSYRSWWKALPLWLKLVTVCGAYPPWLFIIYCILSGQEKSWGAIFAFSIFAICTLLHIMFDRRNRLPSAERHPSWDIGSGDE